MRTDLIVVGAGCAGLTAAIYAARAGKSVLVLEQESVGGQIAFSPRVENYPGIPSISGMAFADALFAQADALGAALELEKVLRVEPGESIRVVTEDDAHECRRLILAPGAKHRRLGLPREEELTGRGVSYCATCDGAFYKGKTVAVAGGGSTALQSAELLAGLCEKVYLIHRRDAFRGEPGLSERVLRLPNVEPVLNARVTALLGGSDLTGVEVGTAAGPRELTLDGLFVCVGQEPNTAFLSGVVALDGAGYILAGEDCRTNVPGVFAAGDCRVKQVRQLTTAAADGSVAALAAVSG